MLALTEPTDGLEGEGAEDRASSTVQAVVNFAGPCDLVSLYGVLPAAVSAYMAGKPEEQRGRYEAASPISYARADAPPILTVQGDSDIYVPPDQALLLDRQMKGVGARHTLVVKEGGRHEENVDDEAVWSFLDQYLKAPRAK
jgi:dipeptidyl aminopeptidase/acylaminoacyl peptidase